MWAGKGKIGYVAQMLTRGIMDLCNGKTLYLLYRFESNLKVHFFAPNLYPQRVECYISGVSRGDISVTVHKKAKIASSCHITKHASF